MDIEKIKTVLAVAKTQSFSEASYEVSLSQSSVSKQVKSVEDELGITLFTRSNSGKSVALTDEGNIFLSYAADIVGLYGKMTGEIKKASKDKKIPFAISSIPMPGVFSRSAIISAFFVKRPEVDIIFISKGQNNLHDALLKKDVDAAIVRVIEQRGVVLPPESMLYDPRLEIVKICENPCVIAVKEDHRLADHDFLTLYDIKDEDIILQRPAGVNNLRYNLFVQSCVNVGFEPRILPTVDPKGLQGEADLNIVRQGRGVMVIHAKMPQKVMGMKLIPLVGLDWRAKTIVVHPKDHKDGLVKSLIHCLKDLADT